MKPWVVFDVDTREALCPGNTESAARYFAREFAGLKPGRRIGYADIPVPDNVVPRRAEFDALPANGVPLPYLIYAKPCDTFCT